MNKKFIVFLILFSVSILAISTVNATDLEYKDFDGYFSVKVPSSIDFQKDLNESREDGFNLVTASYMSENLAIIYMDSTITSNESASFYYQTFFEGAYPESVKCYESQEGDLKIMEPIKSDGSELPMVCKSSGNRLIIIMGDDIDLIKEMGHSIKFE